MQVETNRRRLLPLIALIMGLAILGGTFMPRGAALEAGRTFVATSGGPSVEHALRSELDWLKSTQRPDGAITFNARRDRVVPYFANLAALPLLESDPGAVRLYLEWYLDRLNMPDRFGLAGTVYDRYYQNGREKVTEDYDSADSYAATFLSLVRAYQQKTGDNQWVLLRLDKLDVVAQVIITLQDDDGLVWAKPNHKMKYLMDNSENYKGLYDWSLTLAEIGRTREADYYSQKAVAVQSGIENKMWDPNSKTYLWGIGRYFKRVARKGVWYPDNVAQMYPAVFGVIPEKSEKALSLYDHVNKQFPDWPEYTKDDPYPWTIMAYAAYRAGDVGRVARFLDATDNRFIRAGRPEPWHSMESGFYLLTCQAVDKSESTASTK